MCRRLRGTVEAVYEQRIIEKEMKIQLLVLGCYTADRSMVWYSTNQAKEEFYEELEQLVAHFLMYFMFFEIQNWECELFVTLWWLLQMHGSNLALQSSVIAG